MSNVHVLIILQMYNPIVGWLYWYNCYADVNNRNLRKNFHSLIVLFLKEQAYSLPSQSRKRSLSNADYLWRMQVTAVYRSLCSIHYERMVADNDSDKANEDASKARLRLERSATKTESLPSTDEFLMVWEYCLNHGVTPALRPVSGSTAERCDNGSCSKEGIADILCRA